MAGKIKIQYIPDVIDSFTARQLYEYLKDNIDWEDGVYSSTGQYRLSKPVSDPENHPLLFSVISEALSKITNHRFSLHGIYLNYYRDGKDSTPTHKHEDTCQVIISLGATRILKIATKEYKMTNGSVAMFGPSLHSVPHDTSCENGRISIALFTTLLK
jgi:hypothetical protein